MVINQTIIATNDSFKLVWDEEEKEYQIIRKDDLRVREREDNEKGIVKIWNLGYASDDSKIELMNEVLVSKLAVGDKIQVGKDVWVVTYVTLYNVVLLTSSGYYCTLNQKSVLDWVSINQSR